MFSCAGVSVAAKSGLEKRHCGRSKARGKGKLNSCPKANEWQNDAVTQNLDELFDVVDEQDRVTGQAARREVHARGWRHRAVHLLVVNSAQQIFLHKRSKTKDLF